MNFTKKILVLILFQGLLPGVLCQRWDFPSRIDGLIGSCLEIPCTFYPSRNSGTSSTVWYLYSRTAYVQIFNTQGSSQVEEKYKNRTSLVQGNSSCSLRIDPVISDDGNLYYPGIAEDEDTHVYSLHGISVTLTDILDTPNKPKLAGSMKMTEGRPEDVECSVEHTCRSSPPSLTWNKPGRTRSKSEDLSGGSWREILTLTYIPSYEDDKTQIQCTATYHNGITSHNAATLDIRYAPTEVEVIVHQPNEGATELECSFVSTYPNVTHYTWMKNGTTLTNETGQILLLYSNEDESGLYSCVAHNTAGSSESTEIYLEDRKSAKQSSNLILIVGVVAGVTLLIIIAYVYTRIKACQKSRDENSQCLDAIYTDLVKAEISKDYDTLQISYINLGSSS